MKIIIELQARCHVSRKWNRHMEWEVDDFATEDQCLHEARSELECWDHVSDMRIIKTVTTVIEETKPVNP